MSSYLPMDLPDGLREADIIRRRYQLVTDLMKAVFKKDTEKTLEAFQSALVFCKAENVDPLTMINLALQEYRNNGKGASK